MCVSEFENVSVLKAHVLFSPLTKCEQEVVGVSVRHKRGLFLGMRLKVNVEEKKESGLGFPFFVCTKDIPLISRLICICGGSGSSM